MQSSAAASQKSSPISAANRVVVNIWHGNKSSPTGHASLSIYEDNKCDTIENHLSLYPPSDEEHIFGKHASMHTHEQDFSSGPADATVIFYHIDFQAVKNYIAQLRTYMNNGQLSWGPYGASMETLPDGTVHYHHHCASAVYYALISGFHAVGMPRLQLWEVPFFGKQFHLPITPGAVPKKLWSLAQKVGTFFSDAPVVSSDLLSLLENAKQEELKNHPETARFYPHGLPAGAHSKLFSTHSRSVPPKSKKAVGPLFPEGFTLGATLSPLPPGAPMPGPCVHFKKS